MSFDYGDEFQSGYSQDDGVAGPTAAFDPLQITVGGRNTDDDALQLDDDPITESQTQIIDQVESNKEEQNKNKENRPVNNSSVDLKDNKRWPQYKTLVKEYPGLAFNMPSWMFKIF